MGGFCPRDKSDAVRQTAKYLRIYEEVMPDDLHDFLRRACSVRALADRADVDGDRLATLLVGMSRDPVDFGLDARAYLITLQPFADMMKPPDRLQREVEALIARSRKGHVDAVATS